MSRRKSPSAGDRHQHRAGRPVSVGGFAVKAVAPPVLKPGQRRCPACRNAVGVTKGGWLRRHRDLFGDHCWNKATGDRVDVALPSIEVPALRTPPPPRPKSQPREKAPSRLDAGSECVDCGKWLPGERSVCGRCYVKRNGGRSA